MKDDIKTSDNVFGFLVKLIAVLFMVGLILYGYNTYLDKQEQKEIKKQIEARLPIIEERIQEIIDANKDIYNIKTSFEYDGVNFIELYVEDTWFYSTDIQKKRFASDVRDNIHIILVEEGFIKSKDRLGIYVYSLDKIKLAESNMQDDIKIIE